MADFGNTSVFSQVDANNNTGTMPSWSGTAAPSTLDNAGRALQGAVTREWNWRNITLTAAGTANAKTLTFTTAPDALYNGQIFGFIANTANSATCTLNINSLGAKTIKKDVAGTLTALSSGDMPSGTRVLVSYNLSDDSFCWINWQGSNAAASDTASGIVELATTTEVLTGTDAARAVTPNALAALWESGGNVTDGATITIGEGGVFTLTVSTTAITAFSITTDKVGRRFTCRFNTVRTLTSNAAIVLPGGADITTAVGDIAGFRSLAGGNVECEWYTRASGLPVVGNLTSATAQASTSGTSIDFTGIPAGTKRITILLSGVSTSGTDEVLIQIGDSGGIETTGYLSASSSLLVASNTSASSTAGFSVDFGTTDAAGAVRHGSVTLTNITGDTWVASGVFGLSNAAATATVAGSKPLSATLDRVRVTTTSGTDTFDAGTINIMYE